MATRNERVVLTLDDDFSTKMARAAATTAALNNELGRLEQRAVVSSRSVSRTERDVNSLGRQSSSTEKQIDKLSGRMRILADVAAMVGPAFVPIGGVAIAGLAGLAAQAGFAAVAAGVMIGSFQGVGDVLTAVNKAALEPTAANIEAAKVALEGISPAAQDFVVRLREMMPALKELRDVGAGAMFPGLTASLDDLEAVLPKIEGIMRAVGSAVGDVAADTAESFNSDRWTPFLTFLRTDAPPAITDLARIIGDLGHGMAELWLRFDPLNDDFSNWLVGVADGFDSWATGLAQTEGFREFIEYVRQTGPQVGETLGALGNLFLQIVQAAAPLGGPVLQAIEAVADALAGIADSGLGTILLSAAAGWAAISRSVGLYAAAARGASAAQASMMGGWQRSTAQMSGFATNMGNLARNAMTAGTATERMANQNRVAVGQLKTIGATAGTAAAGLGFMAAAMSDVDDKAGLANTTMLTLAGAMVGGPIGAGLGASVGLFMDASAAADDLNGALDSLDAAARGVDLSTLNSEIESMQKRLEDMTNTDSIGDFFSDSAGWETRDSAVARQKEALDEAREAAERLQRAMAPGLPDWSTEFRTATQTATEFRNAVLSINDALEGRASWRDYEAAIDDVTRSLKENGRGMDITTEKGRANQQALDSLAGTSLKVAESLQGMDRVRFLQRARGDFIDAANKLGLTRAQARNLADELGLLGKKNVKPEVQVAIDAAMSSVNAIEQRLNAIDGKIATTSVFTYNRTFYSEERMGGPRTGSAAGSTVPITGKGYADRHPYLLADGEEVITDLPSRGRPASTFRPVLKAINSGAPRATVRAMLAYGGTAGPYAMSDSLARRLAAGGVPGLAGGGSGKKRRTGLVGFEPEETEAQRRRREAAEAKADAREAAAEAEADSRERRAERMAQEAEQRAKDEAEAAEKAAEHEEAMRVAVLKGQERAISGLIDAAETQKSAAVQMRDSIKQSMDALGAAATRGFRSELFKDEDRSGLWAGANNNGKGAVNSLTRDIAGLQERQGIIAQLSAAGISKKAIEALLSEGTNEDIQNLIDTGQLGTVSALFDQRASLLESTGAMAGRAVYGQEYDAQVAAVNAVEAQLVALRADLAAVIAAQQPITIYEAISAQATADELARRTAMAGAL